MKKRILSVLLVLTMLLGCMPIGASAEATTKTELSQAAYDRADAIFADIDKLESVKATRNTSQSQITDAVEALVKEADTYVEGSLERNGDAFSWMTTDGIRCAYNPRMREIEKNMTAPEAPLADGIYNEPLPVKSSSSGRNQVYLVGPYYGYDSDFTNQYKNEAKAVATAIGDTDGYTLYSGKAATVDKVAEAVSKGAVVFFDSHGTTDYENGNDHVSGANNSYLCLTSTTGLTSDDYADGALYHSSGVYINGATIANHMTTNSPGGILWMAICLGMATNTICEPLREKGVEVVYGYSQSVTFAGDYLFEETFWDEMCAGKTVAEAAKTMKSNWGYWDFSAEIAEYYGYSSGYSNISSARSNYTAFPVIVSDKDKHPGQRYKNISYGADSMQTVKSTYTLFNRYDITAVSSDETLGTVSVSGDTITATPAVGYEAQGYTVLSGSATVTQNGNVFQVQTESDCTIQINFVPKQVVTVTFQGLSTTQQTGYAGDRMTLPVLEAPEGYAFQGWAQDAIEDPTTTKPDIFTDSFSPTDSMTLYAVYSYGEETAPGDYVKLTEAPDNWEGEYLIVYEGEYGDYMFDGSLTSYDKTSNYQKATTQKKTISTQQGDPYQFTIEAYSTGYAIRAASGMYIGNPENTNSLVYDSSPMVNRISMNTNGTVNIDGSGGSRLRYNNYSTPNKFLYYKSVNYAGSICLYKKGSPVVTTWYVTLQNKCAHLEVENGACTECGAAIVARTEAGYWATVQEAANSKTGVVQLLQNVAESVKADTLQLDLNGHTLQALTVTKALYGYDSSATAAVEGKGSICTLNGPVSPEYTADGIRYIALGANGGYTFHVLEMSVETVSLRTDATGLYYRGAFACDNTLREAISVHGIALSTVDMPDVDYKEAHNLITEKSGAPNGEFVSVMVSGILKEEAEDNDARGKMAIYANAYLVLKDGSVLLSDNTNADTRENTGFDGVAYSLYDVMTAIDRLAPTLSAAKQTALERFCNAWYTPMADWQLENLIG